MEIESSIIIRVLFSLLFLYYLYTNPGRLIRQLDPVGSYRKIYRTISDTIGIRWKLSESLVSDSDRKLSDVGKCRNTRIPTGITVIPTLSVIRQLPVGIRYQRFCRNSWDPIGSYWSVSPWGYNLLVQLSQLSSTTSFLIRFTARFNSAINVFFD